VFLVFWHRIQYYFGIIHRAVKTINAVKYLRLLS
jgi:hypothetical protein